LSTKKKKRKKRQRERERERERERAGDDDDDHRAITRTDGVNHGNRERDMDVSIAWRNWSARADRCMHTWKWRRDGHWRLWNAGAVEERWR